MEGDARQLEHLIAVKAIYDEHETALREIERLEALNEGVTYVVLPTRHVIAKGGEPAAATEPKRPAPIAPDDATVASALETLRAAKNLIAHNGNRAALLPLAAEFAELLVSKTLQAVPAERGQNWDLVLGDKRIEVKATIEEPTRRAPTLHFSSLNFDELAIVQLNSELEPTGVFRIAAEAVKHNVRSSGRKRLVLRLTPEFLRVHAVRLV